MEITRFTSFEDINDHLLPGIVHIRIENEEDYTSPLEVKVTDFEKEVKMLNMPPDTDVKRIHYVLHGKEVVALGRLQLNTGSHNRNNAMINVRVRGDMRRKGYGRILLKEIVKDIPEEVERLFFSVYPMYQSFLEYLKNYPVTLGMTDRRSASDLRKFIPSEVAEKVRALRDAAINKGYEFVYIDDLKFPEGFDINSYRIVLEEIWNDMPTENLQIEDAKIDENYFDVSRRQIEVGGHHNWLIIAMKDKKAVGLTDVYLDFRFPELIYQGDTGVIKEHRGNSLGLTLKYMMLEKILFHEKLKDAKYIQTHNAKSNDPMIRINNELRYEEVALINEYQIQKSDLLNILADTE